MKRDRFYQFLDAIRAMRDDADDEQALNAQDIYPEWEPDTEYPAGFRALYDGTLYICLQLHRSQTDWTPPVAVSLWAKVLIPGPGIPEWEQPSSTNPYMLGDKVRHNDKIWVSTIDYNIWEPGVFGWDEVVE